MRTQKKLVEKLEAFTNALGDIVEILKEDVEKRKESASDNLAASLSDNITKIAEDISVVKEDVKNIKKDTQAIREAVKDLKTQKEKGMLGEVSDKKSFKQIKQGIAIIMLLAGAVLAIGLAFKIIGKVDFASVIALSLGIIAIATAARIIADMEGLSYKKAIIAAATMVILAGAVAASSWVLKYIQPMTKNQIITTIALAGALGITIFLTIKALNRVKLKPSSLLILPLLPLILPLISLGIMLSSQILTNVVPIPLMNLIGIVILAVAVAAMMFAVKPILSMKLSGKDVSKILLLPLVVPIMALAIVAASHIFKLYKPIGLGLALSILVEGVAMGLAIAAFALSVYILGKLDIKALAIGALGVVMVATAIVGASWLMALFNPEAKAPPFMWTLKTGLALIIFSIPTIMLGFVMQGSAQALLLGIAGVVLVATAIVAASWILNFGNYEKFPPVLWTLQVGLALVGFSIGMIVLGIVMQSSPQSLILGLVGVSLVSLGIVAASKILSKGTYKTFPPLKWVFSVGAALVGFSIGMIILGFPAILALLAIGKESIKIVSNAIVESSFILSKGTYKNYPSLKWALGVTSSLLPFGLFMAAFGALMLASFGMGTKILNNGVEALKIVSQAIVDSSYILSKGTYKTYPTLDWAFGVGNGIAAFATTLLVLKVLKQTPDGFVDFIRNLALGLVVASHYMGLGNWTSGAPTKEWAEAVGIGIGAFATPFVTLAQTGRKMMKMIAKDPEGFKQFIIGFIRSVSYGLVEAANILATGKWGGAVPTKEWTDSVALAIDAFTYPIIKLAESGKKIQKAIKKGDLDEIIITYIKSITRGLVKASEIFDKGNWNANLPSKKWVDGANAAIMSFVGPMIEMTESDLKPKKLDNFIRKVGKSIWMLDDYMNQSTFTNYPSEEWINGIRRGIRALILKEDEYNSFFNFIELMKSFNKLPLLVVADKISALSKSFSKLGRSLELFGKFAKDNLKHLTGAANSVMLLSVIDTKKVEETLNAIEAKTNTLRKVASDAPTIMQHLEELLDKAENVNVYTSAETGGSNESMNDLVKHVANIDRNIEEMLTLQKDTTEKADERYEKEMESAKNVNDDEGIFT